MAAHTRDSLPERHQNTLLSSSEAIFAARCSVKDAKWLEDLFLLTGTEIRLHELKDGSAYLVNQGTRTGKDVIPHDYPLTEKVAQKTIARGKSQYTTPHKDVDIRVNNLFGG